MILSTARLRKGAVLAILITDASSFGRRKGTVMKYFGLILKALAAFNNDQWDIESLREREFRPVRRGRRSFDGAEARKVIGF